MPTATSSDARLNFRRRLRQRDPLDGVLVRTPAHNVVEVIAATRSSSGCDVGLLDAEHAPFGVTELDCALAVAFALEFPCLVRVRELQRSAVQQALDLGAVGVVVPHVMSAEAAARVVRYAHYGPGGRGFSGSTRSAGWGARAMSDVLETAAATTTVVIQVEDPPALDVIDEIVAVPGIDAVFIGAADLAVGLGCTRPADAAVDDAIDKVIDACSRGAVPVAAIAPTPDDVGPWRDRGAALVFHGTDQSRLYRPGWNEGRS